MASAFIYSIRDYLGESRGGVMPLFSILLLPMIGATAAAVDYAVWLDRKAHLQSVADISALAGARGFAGGSDSLALAQANQWLDGNLTLNAERSVEIVQSGNTIGVSLAMDARPILSGLLSSDGARIGVNAVAYADSYGPHCILALNETADDGILVQGSAKLEAAGCTLWSNSNSSWSYHSKGNSTTIADRVCVVGKAWVDKPENVPEKIDTGCAVKKDPFADWEPPTYSGSCQSVPAAESGVITLQPGRYCDGLEFGGNDRVVLSSGEYYIEDDPFKLRGNAEVTGEQVGIYLTGWDARLDFAGTGKLDISAPTDGPMKGLAIARDPSAPSGEDSVVETVYDQESGVTGNFELSVRGTAYLPHHTFRFWGNNNTHARASQIVADRIHVGGHGTLTLVADDEGSDFAPSLQSEEMVRLVK